MRHLLHYRLLLTLALQLLFQYALPTLANTEIINFAAGNPISLPPLPQQNWTVLHAGTNEIILRDRIPMPLLDAGAPSCDNDDDAMDLLRGSSRPPHCPHDLWLVLDLDGDEWDGDNENLARWKNYDRFTLRVSWPASDPIQVVLSLHRPIVSSATALSSSARVDTMASRRLHLARIRLKQEGISVPGTQQQREHKKGVPLVVLLEPLILGILPASVLPTVVTLLVVLGAAAVACIVLPYVLGVWLGRVIERARRELALLGERKGKERID